MESTVLLKLLHVAEQTEHLFIPSSTLTKINKTHTK